MDAIHRLVDKLTANPTSADMADLIRDNIFRLVLMALGDAQVGGPMATALGLPREIATESLAFALMQEAAKIAHAKV